MTVVDVRVVITRWPDRSSATVAEVAILQGGAPLLVDEVKVFDPEDRTRFLGLVGKEVPGVDPNAIGKQLAALLCDDGWCPEPTLSRPSAPVPPFPIASAFPPGLQKLADYLRAVAEAFQVPVDMPALLFLPIASITLAHKVVASAAPDWREQPVLWSVVLMRSGDRKSPVLTELLAPVRRWEQSEIARLEAERARWRERQTKATPRSDARGSRDDGATVVVDDPEPPVGHFIAQEPTPEALASLLSKNGERGLIAAAEVGALEVLLGRYNHGKPNFSLMNAAYTGEPWNEVRVAQMRDLKNPLVAVALAVQPGATEPLLSSAAARDSGFLARFLYAQPESMVGRRSSSPPAIPAELRKFVHDLLDRILSAPRPDTPAVVGIDDGALRLLTEFREVHERRLQNCIDHGISEEWYAKLPGQVVRIALVLEVLIRADPLHSMHSLQCITEETMGAALAWVPYLEAHQAAAGHGASYDRDTAIAARVLRWIRAGKLVAFRVSDAYRACRSNEVGGRNDMEGAFDLLEEAGIIRLIETDRPGPGRKPSPVYRVNPNVIC